MTEQAPEQQPTSRSRLSTRTVVVLAIIALFAGVLAAKFLAPAQPTGQATGATAASLTSVRNDATADYEAAAKTGKPIYVLFHSLT